MNTILVTGGAGFVGSNLALSWKRDFPDARVISLDNLKRRGSELTLPRLRAGGIEFVHGDVRNREDLESLGDCDLLLECSAEPSVQAGYDGDARYLLNTNLAGTLNCLEYSRTRSARMVFLSTSRVYPIAPVRALPLEERGTRLVIPETASGTGWSARGISEDFPLTGPRSLYGATKLASELFIEEYVATYGMQAVVNRCGVLTGPWQMGKVDQGFVTLWASQFLFGGRLGYIGFGGKGVQIRDILHVEDLHDLIKRQTADFVSHSGQVYNAGGGASNSISLCELTALCKARTGATLEMGSRPETHPADIPYYVTDNSRVTAATGWVPQRSVEQILDEVFEWLRAHRAQLEPLLLNR